MICLLAFAAFGVLYFQNWVVQKPFGIILFVGEGLTAQRTAATRVYIGGANNPLAIDGLEFSARLSNHSADFAVPDSPAAASALATGTRVKNGTVAIAESGAPLETILEIAHKEGRATGVVTDGARGGVLCPRKHGEAAPAICHVDDRATHSRHRPRWRCRRLR